MVVRRTDFQPSTEVQTIDAPHLTDAERDELLRCVNDVRAGRKVFLVRLTNRKVRKADGTYRHNPKREAGVDYRPDPALAPHAHEGLLTRAPTNKRDQVYLYLRDSARSPEDGDTGHTCISLEGIQSFKVLGEFSGPVAAEQAPASYASLMTGADPRAMLAQAMLAQAQAMITMAMVLQQQAIALQQQSLLPPSPSP